MIRRNYRLLCNFFKRPITALLLYLSLEFAPRRTTSDAPECRRDVFSRAISKPCEVFLSRASKREPRLHRVLRFTAATNGRCYRHFVFLATVPLCEWISSEPKVIAYASLSTKLLSWCIRYRTRLLLLQLRQSVVTWDVAGGRARAKSTE